MQKVEPEREMVRRALPFLAPSVLVAFLVAALFGDVLTGVSAAIGGLVVVANFVANGYSLAWAARTSPAYLAAVAGFGFFVRLAVIFGVELALSGLDFFSPTAFALTVVPLTLVLLALELKMVAGPLGRRIDIQGEGIAH